MYKEINGEKIAMTAEEIAEMQAEVNKASIMERSRTLSQSEVLSMLIPTQINTLKVDDNTALRMIAYYPVWAVGVSYPLGYIVQHKDKLYRVIQEHTSLEAWPPDAAASLFTVINETHSGTKDDPIPYSGNMALENGLYYVQDYVIYLCTRDTVNPAYNSLAELVGLYVEKA